MANAAVLSPHLDDAVLSCWHVLTAAGRVDVINVCAGIPADDGGSRWWDKLTGASDSRLRMRERIEEDRQALEIAGRDPINLDVLDSQYRIEGEPVDHLVEELRGRISPGTRLYAPAGIGEVPDHVLVRSAALQLRQRGHDVRLYAELPHALRFGWPGWVANGTGPGVPDPGAYWDYSLSGAGLAVERLSVRVERLSRSARDSKRRAWRTYRTQLAALDAILPAGLAETDTLAYEIVWELD